MLRRALFSRRPRSDVEDTFRWRGEGVSRLENLSDIVFAFAISFLVATAEVPETFGELLTSLADFVAIGAGFAILLLVWHTHYLFFRRYGLEDGKTVVLNGLLLFLILFYVYPLQFLFGFQIDLALGRFETGEAVQRVLTFEQVPLLQVVYSGGFAAVFGIFALLYRHALAQADALDLSPAERVLTRERIALGTAYVAVALATIVAASLLPGWLSVLGGALYFAIWPVTVAVHRRYRRELEALTEPG